MAKKFGYLVCVSLLLILTSGCALLSTALSAGAAYGIYQATKN